MKPIGKKTPPKPVFDDEGYQTNLGSLNGAALPDLSQVRTKPFKHGGARRGAGRKPAGKEPIFLHLSPQTIRKLRQAAKRQNLELSATAEKSLLFALNR